MTRLATLLALAAVALAGCGSDDEGPQTSAAPPAQTTTATAPQEPTRAEYIEAADAVCKQANAEAKDLNERIAAEVEDADSDRAAFRAIAPILQEGIEAQDRSEDRSRALAVPSADTEIIDNYIEVRSDQAALIRRLLDAAKSADAERFSALTDELDTLGERGKGIAQGFGFEECGSGRNEAE